MSSAGKLYRQLLESQSTSQMQEAFDNWQVGHCYYAKKMNVYDAHTQTLREMMVRCGRCYNCQLTKINEWCTRMYAHAEDFKNVYFVTLTYRSFVDLSSPVSRLIIDKLRYAIWHKDALNATKHMSYNPCVLCKAHYQNFLKRLRKNTGFSDITYVMSGEYGHDYGRPHFHLVLFTNNVLTKQDIVRAWSICLWCNYDGSWQYRRAQKKCGSAYDFPIGRVDFHDLVRNGSFNTTAKIRVDGTYMNAANCFAYVCKYVCKYDTVNYDRVKLAYNSLYHKYEFVKLFDSEVQWNIIRRALMEYGYPYERIDNQVKLLKKYRYEKVVFSPDPYTYAVGVEPQKSFTLFGYPATMPVLPSVYFDFRHLYRPFCEFSRGTPIGSIYSSRHIQEHTQGVFTRPLLQEQSFIVPSYFRRKAADYLFGLRRCHQTLRSRSYSLGGLVDLSRRLYYVSQDSCALPIHINSSDPTTNAQQALSHPYLHYRDAYTGEKIVNIDDTVYLFKFNRHTKSYVFTRSYPIHEWVQHWSVLLSDEFKRHDIAVRNSMSEMELLDSSFDLLDVIRPFSEWRDTFVNRATADRKEMNKFYHQSHMSVE